MDAPATKPPVTPRKTSLTFASFLVSHTTAAHGVACAAKPKLFAPVVAPAPHTQGPMAEYFQNRAAHLSAPPVEASDDLAQDGGLTMFSLVQHLMLPCPRSDFDPSPWNQTAGPLTAPMPYSSGGIIPWEDATQHPRAACSATEEVCFAEPAQDLNCVPSNGAVDTTDKAAAEQNVIVTDPEFLSFGDGANFRAEPSWYIDTDSTLTDHLPGHNLVDAVPSFEEHSMFPEQVQFEATNDPALAFFTQPLNAM